jgi:hypothetical protein
MTRHPSEPSPRRRPHRRALSFAALVITACSAPPSEERFEAVADLQELMLHVLEPAAQEYWAAVGWILDAEGEHYIHPTGEEEWLAVENAAFMVAESGNLLMMRERALDDGTWMAMSQALIDIGRQALQVAEARDEQGVFDRGAEMYQVCSACHAAYSPEVLRPSDDRFEASDGAEGRGEGE